MKQRTTMKDIRNNWNKVFKCGYCELQDIMRYHEPQYYNCGVYGWNCDIYVDYKNDIAVTTGYRSMTGKDIPRELLNKYSEIARNIDTSCLKRPFPEIKEEFEQNMENFFNELNNL